MRRSTARRRAPVLEDLEGRHLQSALVATTQATPPATPQPYLEQGTIFKSYPEGVAGVGGETQIIAILIG